MHLLRYTVFCMIALVATPAMAQDVPQAPPEGGGPRGPGRWLMRMHERLATQLELDEQQRAQFDEIAARHREQMRANFQRVREEREQAGDAEGQQGEGGEGGRPRWRGFMGGGGENPAFAFFDEIEPILREEQIEQLDTIRDGMERRDADRRLPRELREKLNLDEEQSAKYEEVLEGMRSQRRERWEAARPLFEEMRAADESGDEQRIAAAQARLEELGGPGDEENFRSDFLAQVEAFLREDQKAVLEEYREEPAVAADGAARSRTDYRTVLKAAKRAKLTAEQADRLKEIEREASRTARSHGRRDAEAQAMLTASVTEDVRKLLNEEQLARFERVLERYNRPRAGR